MRSNVSGSISFTNRSFSPKRNHLDIHVVIDNASSSRSGVRLSVFRKQPPQNARQPVDHAARLIRIGPNQRRNRVQRIKQKMRINLTGKCRQPCFIQTQLLRFQLLLIAGVVPDLERQHDGKHCAGADGYPYAEVGFTPQALQRKHCGREPSCPTEYRSNSAKMIVERQKKLKQDTQLRLPLAQPRRIQTENGREPPDVFFLRSNVPQQNRPARPLRQTTAWT